MTRHSVNNNRGMGLVISLCSNSNHLISLIPPQTASNFRHLLSCGTKESISVRGMFSYETSATETANLVSVSLDNDLIIGNY